MPAQTLKAPWRSRFLRPNRESWKKIFRIRFLGVLFLLIGFSMLVSGVWAFQYAGLLSHEALQRAVPQVKAKHARVVFITPEDYRERFAECLTPAPLDAAIQRILEFNPAVLVVDLDTSAMRFLTTKSRENAKIVWARDAEENERGGDVELTLLPVLGRMDLDPPHWGLSLFPRSRDWTIRNYKRTFTIGSRQRPSLHWEAVTIFCASAAGQSVTACDDVRYPRKEAPDDLTVPVLHARYWFEPWHLGDVLGRAGSGVNPRAAPNSELARKIVLLGGWPVDETLQQSIVHAVHLFQKRVGSLVQETAHLPATSNS